MVLCGISRCFHLLSPCLGQIAHALLTRPPLEYQFPFRRTSINIPARLACVKHAASVRPEPGSNSDVQSFILSSPCLKTGSPKPVPQLSSNKRFTLPNLTVSCTVCTFSVSFSRIAPPLSTFHRRSRQRMRLYHIPIPLSTLFLQLFNTFTLFAILGCNHALFRRCIRFFEGGEAF